MHALSGHVEGATAPPVVQLEVGSVKKKDSGSVIAAVEGREEEGCLTLTGRRHAAVSQHK